MPVNVLQMKIPTWLLLLYALPVKQTSARVNLWRQLKRFGAVQLKTSAYVLPDDPTQYERFQWLSREIRDAGGEATLIRVADIEGTPHRQVVQMFNDARTQEYSAVRDACGLATARKKKVKEGELASELGRQQRRFQEIKEVDYFGSPAAYDAQMALQRLEKMLHPKSREASQPTLQVSQYQGKTWLTRPRPGIDRAGSAWLIRKFIDTRAKFVFGTAPSKHPGALPFDMADVEFSHHGEDCTFETLVKRFGIADSAVLEMAEMVHDADLEDGKFQRTECLGINSVLSGWARTRMSDAELLAKGIECFDGLYQWFNRSPASKPPRTRKRPDFLRRLKRIYVGKVVQGNVFVEERDSRAY
jgi:hypothetical protein